MSKYPISKEFEFYSNFTPPIAQDAPTTKAAINKRIDFMRRHWEDAE